MATSIPCEAKASTDACLVCLEKAEHLKVVGLCGHAFCEPCLTKHLKDAEEVFPCPSCQSECPIPSDGVAGLEDLVSSGDASSVALTTSEDVQNSVDDAEVPPQNCSVCDTLKATSNPAAISFCDKCDMFFCEECGEVHRKTTATKGHVLRAVGAATYDSTGICTQHGRRLKMFCQPCALPCCGLCVHPTGKHHDHDVCSIGDMIVVAASELGQVLKSASDFVDLLGIQESGTFSAKRAKLDWKETVTHVVEEKAARCINNILQQKAKLLKIVDEDCKTSSEEHLSDVGRMRGELRARIEEGTRLLVNTAADLNHLKRLNNIKANIEEDLATKQRTVLERPDICQTGGSYGSVVLHSPHIFKEESDPVSSIGSMVDDPFSHAEKMHDLQLPADMKFGNIQEIRCLGKFGYAVVCQSDSEEAHYSVMTFNADGKFERVEEDLPAVYGMDVDAHDRLVLLLSGKSDDKFLLKVYDTSGTNAESSHEFPLPKPLSMAISPEGWCNILCWGPENTRIITVVNLEGKLQTAPIAYDGIHDHSRIACSGDTIYTMGSSFIGVCKYVAGKIAFLKPLQLPSNNMYMYNDPEDDPEDNPEDITVDFFDNIFVLLRGRVSHWPWSYHRHKPPTEKLDTKALISVPNGTKQIHFQNQKLLIAGTDSVTVYRLRTR